MQKKSKNFLNNLKQEINLRYNIVRYKKLWKRFVLNRYEKNNYEILRCTVEDLITDTEKWYTCCILCSCSCNVFSLHCCRRFCYTFYIIHYTPTICICISKASYKRCKCTCISNRNISNSVSSYISCISTVVPYTQPIITNIPLQDNQHEQKKERQYSRNSKIFQSKIHLM